MISFEDFEKTVEETVETIPAVFKEHLDNCVVTVEAWPTRHQLASVGLSHPYSLFGLYQGVPKTKRGVHYSSLPDKIIIFYGPVVSAFPDEVSAKAQIKKTVLHEIGHHFGMSEEQIRTAQQQV